MIRVIGIPPVRMAVSEPASFGDGELEKFDAWFSGQPKSFAPQDFLWSDPDGGGFVWGYALLDDGIETEGFRVIDFPGGLYATAVYRDMDGEGHARAWKEIQEWIAASEGFEADESRERPSMGHIITPPEAAKAMGFMQMELFFPIRVKG